jgi:lysylphosphatidylglycerol synthetase-like protein (DUF2156 family)
MTLVLIAPSLTMAAGFLTIVPPECNGLGGCPSVCSIGKLAQNLLNDAIYLAVFVAALLFAYAGLQYLTNMGNPNKVADAKKIFLRVVVGLLIILTAWFVVDILISTLTGGNAGGKIQWNRIC